MTRREVVVPDVGEGGMEVVFVRWLVEEGQTVEIGDELFELDTAKANLSVQAFAAGTITGLAAAPDDEVERGQVVAVISPEASGEHEAPTAEKDVSPVDQTPSPVLPAAALEERREEQSSSPRGERFISPKVKHEARIRGLDLSTLTTSNGAGWITSRDLDGVRAPMDERAASSAPAANKPQHSLAASMATTSWVQVPHTSVQYLLKVSLSDDSGTVTMVSAIARALSELPELNVRWDGRERLVRSGIAVGLSVTVGDRQVVTRVPATGQDAGGLGRDTLKAISRARNGVVVPADHLERSLVFQHVEAHHCYSTGAIVPPGDSAILVAVTSREGTALSLTVDQRAIPLATAIRFLDLLTSILEKPND